MGRYDQLERPERLDILPDEILVPILEFACTSIIDELQGTGLVPGRYHRRSFARRLSSFRALQLVCRRFCRLFNERRLRQAREQVIQAQVTRLSSVIDALCVERSFDDSSDTIHTPTTLEWCCGAFWYNPEVMRNLNGRIALDVFSSASHFSLSLKLKLLCLAPTIWGKIIQPQESVESRLGDEAEWEMPQTHRGGAAMFRFGMLVIACPNSRGYANDWYGRSVLSYRLLSKVDRPEDEEHLYEHPDYNNDTDDSDAEKSGEYATGGEAAEEPEKKGEVVEEKNLGEAFDGEYWLWYHPKSRQDLTPLEKYAEWYLIDTLQQRVFVHGLQKWLERDAWKELRKSTGDYYHITQVWHSDLWNVLSF